jgi:hypothetical protein
MVILLRCSDFRATLIYVLKEQLTVVSDPPTVLVDITVETTVEVPAGIVWIMVVSPPCKVEATVEMMVEVPAGTVSVSIEVMMLVMV